MFWTVKVHKAKVLNALLPGIVSGCYMRASDVGGPCDVVSSHVCFLQKDLIHTIGESAALGAAGFVIWGDLNLTSSRVGVLLAELLMGN